MKLLALRTDFKSSHPAPLPFAYSAEKGAMMSFTTPDGKEGHALYVPAAEPTDKVLLIFHEWWGLNDYIKREAEIWRLRLAEASANNNGKVPPDEQQAWNDFRRNRARKLETVLDQGHGGCLLRDPDHSQTIVEALHHFEGTRCEMMAFAVMPNHVHVLCRPVGDHTLEGLCGSWKWFTAQKVQRHLGRQGGLWQEESFDRVIRDGDHYANTVRYIAKNPIAAELQDDEATVWLCRAIHEANS
jgi:REP element-mobilizing transposase RayT